MQVSNCGAKMNFLLSSFSLPDVLFTYSRIAEHLPSIVLLITFLRKFPHSYRLMYWWISATSRFKEIIWILLFVKILFGWAAVELQLGYQEDVWGAGSLSKMHFCPEFKPYIQTVYLMPSFLVGSNMNKACAGSLQLSSCEIRLICPPVNVVSLEQNSAHNDISFNFVVCFCLTCITVYILTL